VWAYDLSRMLYGATFVLGSAYALSRGLHIRSDFLYRRWSVRTQGRVDLALYVACFFPAMATLLYVSSDWAWTSVSRGERGTDTAWMPLLGPVKSTLPIGVAFLLVQGVSEVLKAWHAARKGVWPA
jgi:TRAP-type mannitol/chloroaromatic compound transport system permease small subunit